MSILTEFKKNTIKQIIQNKKAKNKIHIEHNLYGGLSLLGWEIKSLKACKINIDSSYIHINNMEAYLIGAIFEKIKTISSHEECNSTRNRKILLNKHELYLLSNKIKHKGFTAIPISLYWKHNLIKIKIGIGKGKKEYDRRMNIKQRENKRYIQYITKHSNK